MSTKYIVWIKENGVWVEQGDGPLTRATAERIAREIRADFRIPVKIEVAPYSSNPVEARYPVAGEITDPSRIGRIR